MSTHLTISDTAIRQDEQGRYCLNDLHKAAGGEKRHQPSDWLRIQQTQDLVEELEKDVPGIPGTKKSVETIQGKGKNQGTFAVKELVYAYAMWISAKFHIAVIRAYDSMVNAAPYGLKALPKPKKAFPGCLTLEQQEAVQALVRSRAESIPDPSKWAGATITLWSAVKSKFGCSYKEIPAGQFAEVLSLLARVGLKGEPASARAVLPFFPDADARLLLSPEVGGYSIKPLALTDCVVGMDELLELDESMDAWRRFAAKHDLAFYRKGMAAREGKAQPVTK